MKILAPIKRLVDYDVKLRVNVDGSRGDLAYVKMSMNPLDEIADEEAIRFKQGKVAAGVVAVAAGFAPYDRQAGNVV